ncbi:unnamed protein product, partial [Symbiodinium microadriaticum]
DLQAALPESIQKLVQKPKQEPMYGQAVSNLNRRFKAETHLLMDLVQQSVSLQARIDKAKQAYEELLRSMQSLTDRKLEQRLEVLCVVFLGGSREPRLVRLSSGGKWRKPKRFAKQQVHCQQKFALLGPQFFGLDAADGEVEHVSVSGEAVAGDGKEVWGSEGDLQASVGSFVAGTFELGSSSPRGERSVTRSEMPCAPGQSKGCKQGSKERVEDQSSQEAPQARDSVQVEAAGSRQQVQREDFEQRGEHVPSAEEVLVATQEEGVPQFSPEVVIVEASPEDKPRDDGAQEREARQLCADISALLLPLKPGVAVPTEVERKLVVLIERLEQAVPEHSPLWELGFSVCEALSDPWHALEAAQGLCANLIAEPSLHAELHDGVGLQQPVDGSSGEPTLPDLCCHQEQRLSRHARGTVEALQWKLIGAGYEAIGVQAQGLTYTMISLYLKDTEGDVSERDWPEVGAVTPHIMGQVGHDEVSNALGRWAKAMEVCRRGDPQGRGYQVDKVWGTVQETRVVQASKNTAAGWWSRMRRCIITLQSQLSRKAWDQVQGKADAADVFLQREVSRPEEASFVAEVAKAFEQRQVKELGKLRETAEANEAEAQVQASKASQKQYKAWLHAGVAKGMRPLFRSLAKAENVFTRPFQDVTVEERAKLRRQQSVKVWGEAGAEYKPGKVLEAKAKQNPLPPIAGTEIERIVKRVADKA